jgi:ABC-type dipeptide/oligopeptide/nickel transport system permease subunit
MALLIHVFEWGQENNMANEKKVLDNDFTFVQEKNDILDVRLQTKPTTFFKDAMRRFVKNKASVFAASMIGFLVALSILVPIVNTNDIDSSNSDLRFLPPRWAGFEVVGIANGTIRYQDIIVDSITDPESPRPVGYDLSAVVGGSDSLDIREDKINAASPYAVGGMVALRPDKTTEDGGIVSPNIFMSRFSDFQLALDLPLEENMQHDAIPEYQLQLDVRYASSGTEFTTINLTDFNSDFGLIEIENLMGVINDNQPVGFDETVIGSYQVRFRIVVKTVTDGAYPILYIQSFNSSDMNNPNNLQTVAANFTSGNELVLRDLTIDRLNAWGFSGSATKTVYQAVIQRASFVYNPYLAVFGDKTRIMGETELIDYINRGLIRYDFNVGIQSFEILDDASPIRSISSQRIITGPGGVSAKEVVAVVSMYRFFGFDSIPYYLFGTNHQGVDYFKVVFAGLSTSLLLGLAGMLINVSFGMVWGSISGYFGGNVDLVMERFTEILGGVPWIVIMTLAILHLGSNFTTFLLALTLTGWIGVSSLTRSQFYRYKRREYVLASRTLGASDGRLIFRHILPNSIGPIVTSSVLIIPGIIFTEATISYLGLGLQGLPSLGVALAEAQNYLSTSPYLIGWGSVVISILMISFNLFGNGLRDAFNPSLKGVDQ